jgi:hypothetical protein
MEFWLVVGLILGVILAWAAISDRRDRRYHHLRSHSEMAVYHQNRQIAAVQHACPGLTGHSLGHSARDNPQDGEATR